ncbi:hypothetical protein BCR43DRAFT_361617 [Syncephalastrum racemosum]|uniref:Uncharacterized protein n=1 Tax=Syncephalastrum racemosum TaxID=13706 RepID=A0A1X2H4T3_SYNRA|nr:hypothetical protein BCR43DRAFT_361617 [Syncephalastrum racemosum]
MRLIFISLLLATLISSALSAPAGESQEAPSKEGNNVQFQDTGSLNKRVNPLCQGTPLETTLMCQDQGKG